MEGLCAGLRPARGLAPWLSDSEKFPIPSTSWYMGSCACCIGEWWCSIGSKASCWPRLGDGAADEADTSEYSDGVLRWF